MESDDDDDDIEMAAAMRDSWIQLETRRRITGKTQPAQASALPISSQKRVASKARQQFHVLGFRFNFWQG